VVTIRDVAHEAGVSIGTVSRVLNNKPGVSDETRQHVLAVAQEMGYLAPKRVSLPNLIVTHLGLLSRRMEEPLTTNPFYADAFHAVEQLCHESQISLSFGSLNIANGQLVSLPPLVNDERISGIVLMGAFPYDVVKSVVAAAQVPIVLVDNCFPECAWDSVMTDNSRGAHLVTEHLISQGHRHIALIGGPDHPSVVERRSGYEETLRQHDLTPTVVTTPDLTVSDGERAVVELLRQAPETTAFVCSNDSQAIGALRKLQELGYKVPDDFSLVGFDDIHLAQFTSPPVTTVRVDRRALGQLAAQLLLGRIHAPHRPPIKTIVGVELIERASVCGPRTDAIVAV
jgi:DNA-binding LacI/PurR family transcriptional regulator